ncbi:Primosomal protein N' [Catenibacterium mitsuokai]|nr:Primosomal protein N' [Catenibacterium mitsuokai]
MLEKNKTVLMLVPEISLTPMMERIFKERFHDEVAIIHSRLSQGEKYDEYRRIKKGEARIVVGARSAIFAPVENLGLIIMDEEHDMSYKQDNTPRYHTLSIAKMRAEKNNAKIVLGSATPSVETYARAQKGIYGLFEMKERINGKPLPYCEVVDMGNEARQGNYSLLSQRMQQRLEETLNKGEQAMILLNKRGYASFIKCESCGEPIRCPHCDVTLTYHKAENRLKCHLCEYFTSVPQVCPECGSTHLKKIGYGTQKIEEELEKKYPDARIIRFDFDTTRNKNTHLKLLKDFEEHKADIMLGTQMIAKGLDFSNVTFVGVLMADLSLMVPDFRASERTFQLLCQVAGRSGRGDKQGTVMIQTFNPEHYAIKAAVKQDYEAFFKEEMLFRKKAKYPPFCHLVSVIVQSRTPKNVHLTALNISKCLKEHLEKVRIIGPQPAFKMQDIYRERILIKYIESKPIYEQLSLIDDYYNRTRKGGVIVACDFNPYSTY